MSAFKCLMYLEVAKKVLHSKIHRKEQAQSTLRFTQESSHLNFTAIKMIRRHLNTVGRHLKDLII